jgi:glycosyltransferase involved in cell wall biosynthesis
MNALVAGQDAGSGPAVSDECRKAGAGRRWIVSQEGSRQGYAVPLSFHRLGQLRLFYTDIWCRRGRRWLSRGTTGMRALATRFEAGLPSDRVISFNRKAIASRVKYHFRRSHFTATRQGHEFVQFGRWFAEQVRCHLEGVELSSESDCFFGFNTNCLETLELLKARGVPCVVDQVDPGRVEEELVLDEISRWPGWSGAPTRLPDEYWDRLQREWDAADLVLVNSEWSARALMQQGVRSDKIVTVPLAIDLAHDHHGEPVRAVGPLKVLWLGSVILRKGIQYLVEAARLLQTEAVEFLLAGPLGVRPEIVKTFPPSFKVLGRVTRDQLDSVYASAHVFVLPTLSDGFALTQLEAMARGLPVITTPNCGRVVTDGIDGLIVPPRDARALAEAITAVEADREWLAEMSRNALRTVRAFDLPSNARLIDLLVRQRFAG